MTLPEPPPLSGKEALNSGKEALNSGEDADDEASPTAEAAPPPGLSRTPPPPPPPPTPPTATTDDPKSASPADSRRQSDLEALANLNALLGEDPFASRRSSSSDFGLSGPMQDIMDGATIPVVPKYIFKAHEMPKDVRKLLKRCLHTDVTLVAADEEIEAHTKVLKHHGGSLFEMAEKSGPEGRVPLPEMSGEVLREVLRYVYTRTAPAVERMPKALLAAAHRAGLPGLKDRCAEVLVQRMNVHNVTEMFELADNNAEERLKQAAAVMFLENAKEIYDTEEWHASLDLRPAAAMRLVHIAVTKTTLDVGSMSTGTRIMHLIARIYMVAIVPVVGYVLYSAVRQKIRQVRGLDGNGTAADNATPAPVAVTPAEVIADLVNATVAKAVAAVTGVEEDEFFTSAKDEL